MIYSLYVDNYKSLVNFKIDFTELNLMLGKSGSGKTTVLEVLLQLRLLLLGERKPADCFKSSSLTKWQDINMQAFELTLSSNAHIFVYKLQIEHFLNGQPCCVTRESVTCDDEYIFSSQNGTARLYNINNVPSQELLISTGTSGVALASSRTDSHLLREFIKATESIIICSPRPYTMLDMALTETRFPDDSFSNLTGFYRWFAQEHTELLTEVWQILKESTPYFVSTSLDGNESFKQLKVKYEVKGHAFTYLISELSDGEKMLIALYLLTVYSVRKGLSLFIDEPDNYVYLSELQPWLQYLEDNLGKGAQCVLISHNPVVIDYLASARGIWLERTAYGATRIAPPPKSTTPLTVSEYMLSEATATNINEVPSHAN